MVSTFCFIRRVVALLFVAINIVLQSFINQNTRSSRFLCFSLLTGSLVSVFLYSNSYCLSPKCSAYHPCFIDCLFFFSLKKKEVDSHWSVQEDLKVKQLFLWFAKLFIENGHNDLEYMIIPVKCYKLCERNEFWWGSKLCTHQFITTVFLLKAFWRKYMLRVLWNLSSVVMSKQLPS